MTVLKTARLCSLFRRHFSNINILSLKNRGSIHDVFPKGSEKEISDLVNGSPQCIYAGFDPTADSLHIGNLLVIMNLLHWQRSGHNVIALLGGATGRIGDPSGRNSDRNVLKDDEIDKNIEGITKNVSKIFKNHKKYFWNDEEINLAPVRILNNELWYTNMNAIDFVGKIGRNFRMGTMLLKQSVQTRLDSRHGMSFTEFSYQIFQAFDWLKLLEKYNCRFQIGGNDQMGNILAGHDLISRVENKQVYGLTIPLITNEEGNKFGKSSGNAIWLSEAKTSPYSFYQFFLRTKDSDIEKLLRYFTFLTMGEIKVLMTTHSQESEKQLPQKKLAETLTLLVHGENGLNKALTATDVLFSQDIKKIINLTQREMFEIFENAHSSSIVLEPGITVLQLAMKAKCFNNESDAIRIIKAGGFYINYLKNINPEEVLTESSHILPNRISLLRVGKRNNYLIKWL